MAAPVAVLRDLLDRVTALEKQLGDQPASDTLQPNVITINPDGTIGATFTGLVNALGLVIPAGSGAPPVPGGNSIEWVRASDGAVIATIGAGDSALDALLSQAKGAPGSVAAVNELSSVAHDGTTTNLYVTAQNGGSWEIGYQGTQPIVNSHGASVFAQLGAAKFSAAVTGTLTWPGGSEYSDTHTITLPGASGIVVGVGGCDLVSSNSDGVSMRFQQLGGGQILIQGAAARTSPAIGSTAKFAALIWGN